MLRHYAKRPFTCWCKACLRVRGRGLGSQSSGPDLLVAGCTLTKKNHEKRVSDIVVRELKRTKPCAWGCIQSREVWSTEEKANMRSGHFWICKFGTSPGSMTCVEKKFEFQGRKRKWEKYKDTRYSDGDRALVVELWFIGLLMLCQDSRFRSGIPQRVLTTQVLRWQCSST